MSSKKSENHVFLTYIYLRKGIALLTCLLPILLIGSGLFQEIEVQKSLSAYFHACPDEGYIVPNKILSIYESDTSDKVMEEIVEKYGYAYYHILPSGQFLKSIFVSFLITIGLFLYLYKGYHKNENIALNFAGGFAVLVALFPMAWETPEGYTIFNAVELLGLSVHGISATLLVFCVAYVCICRPSKTLDELKDLQLRRRFTIEYNILGFLMIILPVSIIGYWLLFGKYDKWVLWVEIAVLLVFARYWWTKSKEISKINEDGIIIEDWTMLT